MKSSILWMNSTAVSLNWQTSLMTVLPELPEKAAGVCLKPKNKAVLGRSHHPFRFRYRKEVKLTGDYHVTVGRLEERHLYSVPYIYVGQRVTVVWDTETVEVYLNTQRIALHKRSFIAGRSTEDAHMPENHLEYQHSKGRNAAFTWKRQRLSACIHWKP